MGSLRDPTLEMVTHFQELVEQDKAALAQELHDELGGYLIGAVMDLSLLTPRVAALGQDVHDRMRRVRQTLGSAIDLTRRITEQLRPTLLDNVGLFAALRWQFKNASAKTTVKCTEDLPTTEPALSSAAAISLFRSSQEALMVGLGRHDVTAFHLAGIIDDSEIALRFVGNGATVAGHVTDLASLMLESIRVRIRSLGGGVRVERPSSGGLSMVISVPRANLRDGRAIE